MVITIEGEFSMVKTACHLDTVMKAGGSGCLRPVVLGILQEGTSVFPAPGVSRMASNLETTPVVEVACKESLPMTGRPTEGFARMPSGWRVKGNHVKEGSSLSGDVIVVEGDDVSGPPDRQQDSCFNHKDDKVGRPFSGHGGESGWVGLGGNSFDPISPHLDHVPTQLLS